MSADVIHGVRQPFAGHAEGVVHPTPAFPFRQWRVLLEEQGAVSQRYALGLPRFVGPEPGPEDVLIAKPSEVKLGDPFGVGEEVNLDDLAVADREGGDREGLPVQEGDDSGGAVDERALHG